MATFTGKQAVKAGYYFNVREWKLQAIDATAGVLPGDATTTYVRIPVVAMLVLAPVMGLFFVVAMPFLGLAVLIEQGWRKAVPHMHAAREARAAAATTRAAADLRR